MNHKKAITVVTLVAIVALLLSRISWYVSLLTSLLRNQSLWKLVFKSHSLNLNFELRPISDYAKLFDEFEKYKRDVENIIQVVELVTFWLIPLKWLLIDSIEIIVDWFHWNDCWLIPLKWLLIDSIKMIADWFHEIDWFFRFTSVSISRGRLP